MILLVDTAKVNYFPNRREFGARNPKEAAMLRRALIVIYGKKYSLFLLNMPLYVTFVGNSN
jgi:hypothetical protein